MISTNSANGKADKATYVRKSVGINSTNVPLKRTPESSVLASGAIQPAHRTSPQSSSKLIKGGAE